MKLTPKYGGLFRPLVPIIYKFSIKQMKDIRKRILTPLFNKYNWLEIMVLFFRAFIYIHSVLNSQYFMFWEVLSVK